MTKRKKHKKNYVSFVNTPSQNGFISDEEKDAAIKRAAEFFKKVNESNEMWNTSVYESIFLQKEERESND